ncbi:FAD-binding monooxygenase [Rhodococcus pyridinivorans SB3094]|uniref:FAD-binding monooxygenase n=1 Tax=Rhodococcus pyridinivorans SB3094 TaxID=1435356 RepID=V9XCT9_9NOCA|nr:MULTISPECIES: FAD-dependent monooxygenase [Rhodococcus]AHD19834.1 FAD-binding monooxygenase [Rhodococcus pyridinivorans SB3094]MCT7289541.1 FAD-dependent monooxygenase [Rhodococcus sp. PAE-6]
MTEIRNSTAVVIGAGVGGLLAARALSDRFDRVIVVERDTLPKAPSARRCVPQGWHAHALTVRGKEIMDELFPGFVEELIDHGAPTGDQLSDVRLILDGHRWARGRSGVRPVLVSRPFLEGHLRSRLEAVSNVEIIDRCSVHGISVDPVDRTVTGVLVYDEEDGARSRLIPADLLVDASGRSSKVHKFLELEGFPAPEEERMPIHLTYATRRYRREPSHLQGDIGLLVGATPSNPRGGYLLAQEGNSWIVTLAGYGDYAPPLDEDRFVDFAASLPAPELAELLRNAESLGPAVHYRIPSTVRRHFTGSQLPRGYLPFGDTICSFNPVYGQGMSVAAMEALVLRECCAGNNYTLTYRFLRGIEPILDEAWSMSADSDLRMPFVEGDRSVQTRLMNAYLGLLYRAGVNDPQVGAAFARVAHLLDRPESLMRPTMFARVMWGSARLGISTKSGDRDSVSGTFARQRVVS